MLKKPRTHHLVSHHNSMNERLELTMCHRVTCGTALRKNRGISPSQLELKHRHHYITTRAGCWNYLQTHPSYKKGKKPVFYQSKCFADLIMSDD